MATITNVPPSEPSPLSEKAAKDLLPGTTIPDRLSTPEANQRPAAIPSTDASSNINDPVRVPGPSVNSRPTILTLYSSPSQMQKAPCVLPLVKMINASFSHVHEISNTFPGEADRLSGPEQYLIELGNDPATFVYVLTYRDEEHRGRDGSDGYGNGYSSDHRHNDPREQQQQQGEVVLATCAGMRFYGNATAVIKRPDGTEMKSSFKRIGFPDPGTEVWEVRHLAVDVGAQKQGLAGWLIGLVEAEARRRFWAARKLEEDERRKIGGGGGEEAGAEKLSMFLTTMKETNGRFYTKRGYKTDDEVGYPVGHMNTRSPFTVLHMSKLLDERQM